MILVDRTRCAYCGSCVSICPVGALDLQETRLVVSELCTECGLCLQACPMGALSVTGEPGPDLPKFRDAYDVAVVGAGPAGSVAAYESARAGLSVLLLEKRQEIGSPVRCAEGISAEALVKHIQPSPAWISARVTRVVITTVEGQRVQRWESVTGPRDQPGGYVLERRVFDRALAERAAQSGADVRVKTPALDLLREQGRIVGVVVGAGSGRQEVRARVVIGADGVESRVGCWAELSNALPAEDLMTCAQFLMAGVDIDPECTYYYLDPLLAPGGYAWVFPKGDGRANVGLGMPSTMAAEAPLRALTRFIERNSFLSRGSAVALVSGGVPVAPALASLSTDGCLLVGDAARQVDPLTGGGIANGMAAGRAAAQSIARAVEVADVSRHALSRYDEEWSAGIGRDLERNHRLRARFSAQERLSERFVRLFALAVGANQ